jgi:beta-lactamase regulating signal transducer with metallopeptidase domain/archaellum component FlaC
MNPWPWVESLGRASLEGAVLIAAVWAVTKTWPSLPAWSRALLWWLACARLLLGLLPLAAVSVPVFPAATATWWPSAVASTPAAPEVALPGQAGGDAWLIGPLAPLEHTALPVPARPRRAALDPGMLALAVLGAWLLGVGFRVVAQVRQYRRLGRACRQAIPLPPSQRAELSSVLPGFVRVAASAGVPAPLVTGLLRPLVLLPISMLDRPLADLKLAVAHEVGHVRRGDLWLAWVPALAETLFWFHPLLPGCAREYVQACEEACDAQALSATGAAPYDYGRLLLALGVHRKLVGATAIPFGSPHPRQLTRRLSMLHDLTPLGPRARRAALVLIVGFALVGLAPLRIVPTQASSAAPKPDSFDGATVAAPSAATTLVPQSEPLDVASEPAAPMADPPPADAATPPDQGPDPSTSPAGGANVHGPEYSEDGKQPWNGEAQALASSPAKDQAEDPDPDPDSDEDPESDTTPAPDAWEDDQEWGDDDDEEWKDDKEKAKSYRKHYAPKAPQAPRAPRAPRAPTPPTTPTPRAWGYGYGWSDDKDTPAFAYVIVTQEDNATSGSGRAEDFKEARRLKNELDVDFIWVRSGGNRYVIDDPEWIERAHAVMAPQREIGQRQSRLGKMQSRIGAAQSQVGQRQARIGALQAEVGARQGQVAMRMAQRQRSQRSIRDLERSMEELSSEMERLSADMEQLSSQMEPLSRQQEELGSQQEALGREMEKASRETMRALRALVDDAIRSGAARRLR